MRDKAERDQGMLKKVCAAIDRDTFWYVLASRLAVVVPFLLPVFKSKLPLVYAAVLRLVRKSKEQTDEEVFLDLLKRLSEKKGVPVPVTALDTKSEVVALLVEKVEELKTNKLIQLEAKKAALE